MAKKKQSRTYSPRLSNGIRIYTHNRLPPEIWDGLKLIADMENRTASWVVEEALIDYFGLRKPKYKKTNVESNKSRK